MKDKDGVGWRYGECPGLTLDLCPLTWSDASRFANKVRGQNGELERLRRESQEALRDPA